MNKLENILGKEKMDMPSIVKNPFNANSITCVYLHSSKSFFDETWDHRGHVEFKNGRTEGKQAFKGENIDDVLIQIRTFVKQLVENK